MATEYYYTRNGQQLGPVSAAMLRQIASMGQLLPTDRVWKEGLPDWVAAARIKGLYPGGTTAEAGRTPSPTRGAIVAELWQPPSAHEEPPQPSESVPVDAVPVVEAVDELDGTAANEIMPLEAHNHGKRPPVILVAIGLVCITFLAFSSLLPWESYEYGPGLLHTRETTRGIGVVEGKMVSLLALSSAAAVGFGLFLKRLLPVAILAGAATGTCSVVLTFSILLRIVRYFVEVRQNLEYLGKFTPLADDFIKSLGGGAHFALYLAMLTALVAGSVFVAASIRRPAHWTWMARAGGGPFMQNHGPLLITQALALLVGIVVFVIQY